MVKMRMVSLPEIKVVGRKVWISGTDNELFGQFWQQSAENGLLELLYRLHIKKQKSLLNSTAIGVSCVEKDPGNRSFDFFIATESEECPEGLEEHKIPACDWAVFENRGALPFALIDSEMYAFREWLPNSGYDHANAPEMEVYPIDHSTLGGTLVEFWLPIRKKICNN